MEVQSSVYSTLMEVAQQIQLLNSLYLQTLQSCVDNRSTLPGYPGATMYYLHRTTFATRNNREATYLDTMNYIGLYLKFLSGERLDDTELETLRDFCLVYTSGLVNLFDPNASRSRGNFITIVDTYINWLNNIITMCGGTYVYQQDTFSAAATNLVRIAKRYKLMETFYEQVSETCTGLENHIVGVGNLVRLNPEYSKLIEGLPGYQLDNPQYWNLNLPEQYISAPITFGQIMGTIRLSLKFLSDQELTEKKLVRIRA